MKRETRAVMSWLQTGRPRPARIEAEITAHCNLNCRFCWIQDPPQFRRDNWDNELKGEHWLSLVTQTAEAGVELWRIGGGGEPMVRPDVTVPVMVAIKHQGMAGHLTTNGTIFPETAVAQVVEAGWDTVEFSVDGPDAQLHDYLRGRSGAFAKTLAVIRLFQQHKTHYGKAKPDLLISSVLVRDNLQRMSEMIRLAHDEGIAKVSINPMTVMVRAEHKRQIVWSMKIDPELALLRDDCLKRAQDLADQLGVDTNVGLFVGNRFIEETNTMQNMLTLDAVPPSSLAVLRIPCYSPWYMASIRPHGTTGACCRFKDAEAPNLRAAPFAEVWHGDYFTQIRRELEALSIPAYCSGCSPNNIWYENEIREELRANLAEQGLL